MSKFYETPPLSLGLTWTGHGLGRRYGHQMNLWTAEGDASAFSAARKRAKPELEACGYSWTRLADQRLVPCFWQLPEPASAEPARQAVEAALAAVAAESAERARREAERVAAEVARCAARAIPIRRDLAAIVGSRAWQLRRQLSEAEALLASDAWREWDCERASNLVTTAVGNSTRAVSRLGALALPHWYERAADPVVQAAALQACRHLSALDLDWASDRNSSGWSQATCWSGHALSERASLDQGAAAHALAILHVHRKQLTDSQRLALFEEPEWTPEPALAL
ncbi:MULTISPECIES: hypothetical protein [Methylobacterium]|mgnify:CR=1 FL=1|uniref:Uncharacterized protein n=2 Tax=Methylobacterium TaxID=407 RepID=A0A2R4WLY4_9HYPH|nr:MULTISPECIES: hypothetical protein [Methylobacterium]MBZ6411111.1 hypothetical protein [Methylobacterium sp.]AWB22549.1 hypothetical protein DA075_17895 [Methylobacterium currus]MBK3397098.1 hypothetical protein [Methylobacterium ajmalii]MBK3408313.1 hypothetical protein [Methylobacterium ajmalii]MBK3421128.1 hypothetical protein [Methylobacterium ajmalii]